MGSAIAELIGQGIGSLYLLNRNALTHWALGIGAAGGDRPHPAGRGFACTRIPSIPVESQTVGSLYLLNRNALTHWALGIGAAGGDRTHDPWLRRPILYPLSYSRMGKAREGYRFSLTQSMKALVWKN